MDPPVQGKKKHIHRLTLRPGSPTLVLRLPTGTSANRHFPSLGCPLSVGFPPHATPHRNLAVPLAPLSWEVLAALHTTTRSGEIIMRHGGSFCSFFLLLGWLVGWPRSLARSLAGAWGHHHLSFLSPFIPFIRSHSHSQLISPCASKATWFTVELECEQWRRTL